VIPGIDLPHVFSCVDVLTGKRTAGRRAVIIGGGCNGTETAEFLAQGGRHVTVVEVRPEVGLDVDFWNRWVLLDRLEHLGIRMLVRARVEAIIPDAVRVACEGRLPETVEADTVIYAIGAQPYNPLRHDLEGRVAELHVIGDCDTPQRVRQAVDAGFRTGAAV
jgi:pyruvate/2-oxoglutarate dehydrogenase complex dihydrolipoamide dehydrogenase (E3) component